MPQSSPLRSQRLQHSVVFWLRSDAPADCAARIMAFYREKITKVAGVESVLVGTPAGTDREVVDGTYTVMSTLIFSSEEVASAWQTDPVHDVFRETFGPQFERVVIYDSLVG